MLRPSLIIVLMLTATAAGADDGSRLCEMRIIADVELTPTQVIVDEPEHRHVIENASVFRDGHALALDADRRQLAHDYAAGMRQLVPAVSEVALRGALLGLESLALVSAGLADDDATTARAAERIERLATELHLRFDGRHLPADDPVLGASFERVIGTLAADAAGRFAGSLLSFISAALLDPNAASARGDYLERLVERRIKPRAAQIEKRAERHCDGMRKLDALETRLDLFDVIIVDDDGAI